MTGIPALADRVRKARWPGECPDCGRPIRVGDWIARCGYWRCLACQLGHMHNAGAASKDGPQ